MSAATLKRQQWPSADFRPGAMGKALDRGLKVLDESLSTARDFGIAGAWTGGGVGAVIGLGLSIVGAVHRGPIVNAAVIAAMGAVVLTLSGLLYGAVAGALLGGVTGSFWGAVRGWFRVQSSAAGLESRTWLLTRSGS